MKRTGLKIAYWKLKDIFRYPYSYLQTNKVKFPLKGSSKLKSEMWLRTITNEIDDAEMGKTLGFLHSTPIGIGTKTWNKLLPLNTNNLGEWGSKEFKLLKGPQKAEHELVSKLTDLFGGNTNDWTGYATSGATESNIFSAWIGRNFLREKKLKTVLILNQFTHYSIKKAANIVGIPTLELKVDRSTWLTDINNLEKNITALVKKGYKGFLIPITLGFTQTGLNENYEKLTLLFKRLEKQKNIKIFTWIDAAINGLILPFTQKHFTPLSNAKINTFAIDFHKTGMCPIPSGFILYRRRLSKLVTQEVQYLDQDDNTLLGSRPGASPAAMLAVVNYLGRQGFEKKVKNLLKRKSAFISMVEERKLDVEIVTDESGIGLALVSKKPLAENFVSKHGLFAKKWKYNFSNSSEYLYIYKVNFI